mgnify:CR=1 FL=1
MQKELRSKRQLISLYSIERISAAYRLYRIGVQVGTDRLNKDNIRKKDNII